MPKSKLSAFLSLILVFASGALVGAVGHRLYTVNTVASGNVNVSHGPGRKTDPEEARRRLLAEMREKVQLDDEQVKKADEIMDATREQFNQLRKSMDEKMKPERNHIWATQIQKTRAILRPEQLPLYDRYRADREAERKKNRNSGPSDNK